MIVTFSYELDLQKLEMKPSEALSLVGPALTIYYTAKVSPARPQALGEQPDGSFSEEPAAVVMLDYEFFYPGTIVELRVLWKAAEDYAKTVEFAQAAVDVYREYLSDREVLNDKV